MNEEKLRLFREQLVSFNSDDYYAGLPYNLACRSSNDFDDFSECANIIDDEASQIGIDNDRIEFLRTVYETVYFPYQHNYIIKNGNKITVVPPQNAYEDSDLTPIRMEDKIIHLDLGPYIIDENGVRLTQGDKGDQVICNQPIVPIGVTRSHSGEESLIIWYSVYGLEKIGDFPKMLLFSSTGIKKLRKYGIEATTNLVDYFREIERLNRTKNPDFRFIREINSLGWTDDTCTAFFPYDREDYRCSRIDSYPREYNAVVSYAGTLEEWVSLINRFRDADHLSVRIVLAAAFSSVLVKPLGKLPYVLHVWGRKSGSGKTVALMTAASIWGKPDTDGGYIHSLNATANACDQIAQFFCNYPLCLDELQTVKNKKDMENLVYALSEGLPRARGDNYRRGMREQNPWSNCSITSGEQPLISTQTALGGAHNRVIDLECNAPLFSGDPNVMGKYCEQLKRCYNRAGEVFISYIKQEGVLDRAAELCEEFTEQFNANRVTGKQSASAALIMTADTLACECVFQDDLKLTVEDLLPYLKRDDDIDIGEKMHRYVISWVALHKQTMEKERDLGKITKLSGQQVCCIPGYKFTEIMEKEKYDPEVYKHWAKDNGKILIDTDGHHLERKVTINGVPNTYCVCILYEEPDSGILPEDNEKELPDGTEIDET